MIKSVRTSGGVYCVSTSLFSLTHVFILPIIQSLSILCHGEIKSLGVMLIQYLYPYSPCHPLAHQMYQLIVVSITDFYELKSKVKEVSLFWVIFSHNLFFLSVSFEHLDPIIGTSLEPPKRRIMKGKHNLT